MTYQSIPNMLLVYVDSECTAIYSVIIVIIIIIYTTTIIINAISFPFIRTPNVTSALFCLCKIIYNDNCGCFRGIYLRTRVSSLVGLTDLGLFLHLIYHNNK